MDVSYGSSVSVTEGRHENTSWDVWPNRMVNNGLRSPVVPGGKQGKNEEKSPWTISSYEMDYVRVVHGVGFIRFSQEHGRVPDPGRTDPASSIVPSPT